MHAAAIMRVAECTKVAACMKEAVVAERCHTRDHGRAQPTERRAMEAVILRHRTRLLAGYGIDLHRPTESTSSNSAARRRFSDRKLHRLNAASLDIRHHKNSDTRTQERWRASAAMPR